MEKSCILGKGTIRQRKFIIGHRIDGSDHGSGIAVQSHTVDGQFIKVVVAGQHRVMGKFLGLIEHVIVEALLMTLIEYPVGLKLQRTGNRS